MYLLWSHQLLSTRKVATVLLDAMLLDLSRLGHNGLVHNAREAGGQLNRHQLSVQSEGWRWVAIEQT